MLHMELILPMMRTIVDNAAENVEPDRFARMENAAINAAINGSIF